MSAAPLLAVSGLSIAFGGIKAVDEASFTTKAGRIFSIIGPNGAGKTTLFNLISGVYRPLSGSVLLDGEDVTGLPSEKLAEKGLARTFQNLQIFFRMSTIENVMVGCHVRERKRALAHLLGLPATRAENARSRAEAMELLARLNLADLADVTAGNLAYGQLKRLEIARALAQRPKILLLDEPAAGCNPTETAEIDELIVTIAKSGIGIVLVEHDMKLVMGVSDRVLVLTQGRVLIEGTPAEVANSPAVIEAYLGAGLPEAGAAHG
jgi:branched-chain amino acid transport system ATP-binding protein